MKFTAQDILALRLAISTCKLADIDLAVISEGKIRGLSESRNAAIISDLSLSIDPNIQLGITRLTELGKRLALFGDDVLLEAELAGENKIRKLSIKGAKNSKIEFRCTDVAMLDKKYPKVNNDIAGAVITLTRPEVSLISKGIKTLGAEQITLQVKRDGLVHIESADNSNDRFEMQLSNMAEFVEDPYALVFNYNTANTGVFLALLEHTVKEADTSQLVIMKSGNILINVNGHTVFAVARIEHAYRIREGD